jgi:diacylglycerol kinase (ATP)
VIKPGLHLEGPALHCRMSIIAIAHGRLRSNTTLLEYCRQRGADLLFTEGRHHAEELAAQHGVEASTLIAAGGDGTVHEVVNGVMRLVESARPTIDILPLGTGNDTVRSLTEEPTLCDVLRLTYSDIQGRPSTRFCMNVADVGLGGHVVQRYSDALRKLPGGSGYSVAIIRGLLSARPQHMLLRWTMDDVHHETEGRIMMAAIANGRWFGSGLGISPQADMTDASMNLTLVGDVSVATYLRYLPALRRGRMIDDVRVRYSSAQTLSIETDRPVPLEIDGEYVGTSPVSVLVMPRAVALSKQHANAGR